MPFGAGAVVTNSGDAICAKRHLGATPAQVEPNYVGMGVGATGAGRTAAKGDTALSTPVESRVQGASSVVTTNVANDTYQVVATITAAAGAHAVDEAGTFDAAAAGNMDISATFAAINLNQNDQLQLTMKKVFN